MASLASIDALASKLLKRDWWQGLFSGANQEEGARKYTPEELRNLYDTLHRNPVVNESNRAVVVETIRSISEFMIWGDQHEPRIFDFFLENNIMLYLYNILLQPANRAGEVAKQVLQTLGIIIQNVRSETGVFFLFSNNHINNIVGVRFDFDDEEVLGFYISFLKAVSLKLSPKTVNFFVVEPASDAAGSAAIDLPLYSEAIKFAHHREGMVRAGVRTLTLNVMAVMDPNIQAFVCSPPASAYFGSIATYLVRQIEHLHQYLAPAQALAPQALSSLDSQMAEVEDVLSYCNDVFVTGHARAGHLLACQLWEQVVGPHLLSPLLLSAGLPCRQPCTSPMAALYVLERFFQLLRFTPLLNNIALVLLGQSPSTAMGKLPDGLDRISPTTTTTTTCSSSSKCTSSGSSSSGSGAVGALPSPTCQDAAALLHLAPASLWAGEEPSCWSGLMAILHGNQPALLPASLRCLVALVQCPALSPGILPPAMVGPAGPNPWAAVAEGQAARYQHPPGEAQPAGAGTSRQEEGEDGEGEEGEALQSGSVWRDSHTSVTCTLQGLCFEFNTAWSDLRLPLCAVELACISTPRSSRPHSHSSQQSGRRQQQQQLGQPPAPLLAAGSEPPQACPLQGQQDGRPLLDLEEEEGDVRHQPLPYSPLGAHACSQRVKSESGNGQGLGQAANGQPCLSQVLVGQAGMEVRVPTEAQDGMQDLINVGMAVELEAPGAMQPSGARTPTQTEEADQAVKLVQPVQPAQGQRATQPDPGPDLLDFETQHVVAPAPLTEVAHTRTHSSVPTPAPGPLQAAAVSGPAAIDAACAVSEASGGLSRSAMSSQLVSGLMLALQDMLLPVSCLHHAAYLLSAWFKRTSKQQPAPHNQQQRPSPLPSRPTPAAQPVVQGSTGQPASAAAQPEQGEGQGQLPDPHPLPPSPPAPATWPQAAPQPESSHPLALPLALSGEPEVHEALVHPLASPAAPPHSPEPLPASPLQPPAPAPTHSAAPHHPGPNPPAAQAMCPLPPGALSDADLAALTSSFAAASTAAVQELQGVWADAVITLFGLEWRVAHDCIKRPLLRASGESLLSSPRLYPEPPRLGAKGPYPAGLGCSAAQALRMVHHMQRLVALMQVVHVVCNGQPQQTAPLPVCPPGEAWPLEVVEGQQVEVTQDRAVSCQVSFAAGQEKRVYFAVTSPPAPRHDARRAPGHHAAHPSPTWHPALPSGLPQLTEVLHSSPSIVLAEPSPARLNTGVVVALAPLLGGQMYPDPGNERWLHVWVRPSVRGLLKAWHQAASKRGGLLYSLRTLADGHWVLQFQDGDRLTYAVELAKVELARLLSVYKEQLGAAVNDVFNLLL